MICTGGMARAAVVVLTLVLLAGACSGDDDPGPATTAPSAPSASSSPPSSDATSTSAAPTTDPFAIPEVIDAAYVNRVLEALYRIDGEVTREVLASGDVQPNVIEKISDIYRDPQLTRELQALPALLEGDRSRFRNPPGDRQVFVTSVVEVASDCIVALVESDFSAVVAIPPPKDPNVVGVVTLAPASTRADGGGSNPTPWSIVSAELISRAAVPGEATQCT